MSFWGELKRRNVFKVGVAYIIVAWLIVQVANTFFPILNLPTWAVTLVAVLVILGFPLALLFAWAFELTPEGLKKTEHVPLEESITHLTGQKLNYILVGVIFLAVAYILFDNLYLDRRVVQTDATKTIAVLPFEDLSPEKDQEYFVDGLIEELLNSLAQIPDLNVTGRTSSFSFKGSNKTVQEIAKVLGVENILEGSVRKAGNELRITAQLLRGADGFHLWSKTYDRELKDIFEVQEDIAKAVSNELKVKLGVGESLKQLGSTYNLAAYELYLNAKGQLFTDIDRALESIDGAIALDPEFALAWAEKAYIHGIKLLELPPNLASLEHDKSQKAALNAIRLEPKLAEAYIALAFNSGDRFEAGKNFSKAIELTTDPSSLGSNPYFCVHFFSTGYFDKIHDILHSASQKDPLNQWVGNNYIMSLALMGDKQAAEEENERCKALFGDTWDDRPIMMIRLGYGEIASSEDISRSVFGDDVRIDIESKEEAIAGLRRLYIDMPNMAEATKTFIPLFASNLDDQELTMSSLENIGTKFIAWFPVFHEIRQLPRFKELVREIGLVDYWEQFGWPDLCKPTDDGDFECE